MLDCGRKLAIMAAGKPGIAQQRLWVCVSPLLAHLDK
jgi:hypothetical protein